MIKAKISSFSSYAPDNIVHNNYFETIVDTSDEWIQSRTGVIQRRFASADEFTSDLCVKAALNLIKENPSITLIDVDFIIVSTTTPDHTIPSVASKLQHQLQINDAGAIDLSSACAGFVYGLIVAKSLISSGTCSKVLVFGADTLSKIIDFKDRSTCILFGDGAGVALVEASTEENIKESIFGTDGSGGQHLYRSTLSSMINETPILADSKSHQSGRIVFKWAVQTASNTILRLLIKNKITLAQIDRIILHSANLRIIEAVSRQIGYPLEKMPQSIEYFGNTSSASIPIAMHQAYLKGVIKKGDCILLVGFGGGFSFAGTLITL
ncbi:beta-ketoacyl-ACP synthase III [Arcticibacter eurypsychrophilus]|uniref:beta-ketoacyl-ACP synthase III n=1 Tax=Arcticibacter eurypsychrophilus TaxID=1434752 RepID=UPI00084D3537|nr:beta-ketoacyl-ACP synthase III [Arcticibacter eurypsychrophilus]